MIDQLPRPNRLRRASSAFHMAAARAANCGDYPASRWLHEQSERAESALARHEAENG